MDGVRWLSCEDPRKLLEWLRGNATDRKLRLFVCAFWRAWWRPEPGCSRDDLDAGVLPLLEYAEQWAQHGLRPDASIGLLGFGWHPLVAQHACDAANWTIRGTAGFKSRLDCRRNDPIEREKAAELQVMLLRDFFGNPFRPPPAIDGSLLSWHGGTVAKLAESIYAERNLPDGTLDNGRLAVLADALEEAGLDNSDVLHHLREQGREHYRGCWVLDHLLGKS
jgi:hypothetical protein